MPIDSWDEIATCLGIESLKSRRLVSDLCFLNNILLNGFIDCPEILAKIDLKVPFFKWRFNSPFVIPDLPNNNYYVNSPDLSPLTFRQRNSKFWLCLPDK